MHQRAYFAAAAALTTTVLLTTPGAEAQTSAEASCRSTIAKASARYTKTVLKTIERCHKLRNKGKREISVNCNDLSEADDKGKLDKTRDKLRAVVGGSDDRCAAAPGVLALFSRCPSPANDVDDAGATDGIDSFGELAECVLALTDGTVSLAFSEAAVGPASLPNKSEAKCHKEVAKRFRKLVESVGKVRHKCQKNLDKSGGGLTYGCGNTDASAEKKVAKAIAKLDKGLNKRCVFGDPVPFTAPNETLDAIGVCGDNLGTISDCIAARVGLPVGSGLAAMAYELPAHCQAGGSVRTSLARTGVYLTDSALGTGWSGTSLNVDIIDQGFDAVRLTCDADCASCQVRLDTDKTRLGHFCRCNNDSRTACDTVNGADVDDCGAIGDNTCSCYFGAPLPLSSGSSPVCSLQRFRSDFTGTMDIGRGIVNDLLPVTSLVHLGSSITKPCPTCDGDVDANDGVRDGTCSGGAGLDNSCDLNGIHPTFGNVSFDCMPETVGNISGGGLILSIPFDTAQQELTATLACDDAGELCPCRVCSGNSNVGCSSDQDCIDVGAGLCTAGGGAGVQRNACDDGVCGADGFCVNGPTNMYCDGVTRADGSGLLTCDADAACQAQSAGNCTISQQLRCYPDPIQVTGRRGLFEHTKSGIFCIPPTTSIAVNESAGLPGPGTLVLSSISEPRCASDPNVKWEPPGGSNCPLFVPTTTTSTTLVPPLLCGDSVSPVCNGECPAGEGCADNAGNCECMPTTTTTLPLPACGGAFPACAGDCPSGTSCQGDLPLGSACACL